MVLYDGLLRSVPLRDIDLLSRSSAKEGMGAVERGKVRMAVIGVDHPCRRMGGTRGVR